ncbi:hypothetical protein [uncultured Fusobacterium sp.]|uniref:hypothetical protein n=1 Tax=uncultured Fusobacterium sp. TaxID=159267 RepID=UPI0025D406F9|nr:hypothetical protein [uncultured Fusobacterium sp.]
MFKRKEKLKEEIEYITLEDIERGIKSGIIVLENNHFKIIKIFLEKGLDEKERELEIESILDEKIENYDPLEYIEKEIFITEDEELEEIILVLLERYIVETIIKKGKEKKRKVFGIIPAFFLKALEVEKDSNELFIDLDIESVVLTEFNEGKIKDISLIEIEKNKILESEVDEILQYIFEIEEEKINKISFYEKDREIAEIFENIDNIEIEVKDWKNGNIKYNYNYDFLPLEYLDSLKKEKVIKKWGVIVFIIFILQIVLGFSLQYFCNKIDDKIDILESDIGDNQEKIEKLKEKILVLEEEEKLKIEELNKIELKKLRIGDLLQQIEKIKPKGLNILNIEFDGKNKLKIIGNSISEEKILKFQEKIIKNSKFKNFNHDYIKFEEEIYNFQLDVEVYL